MLFNNISVIFTLNYQEVLYHEIFRFETCEHRTAAGDGSF